MYYLMFYYHYPELLHILKIHNAIIKNTNIAIIKVCLQIWESHLRNYFIGYQDKTKQVTLERLRGFSLHIILTLSFIENETFSSDPCDYKT